MSRTERIHPVSESTRAPTPAIASDMEGATPDGGFEGLAAGQAGYAGLVQRAQAAGGNIAVVQALGAVQKQEAAAPPREPGAQGRRMTADDVAAVLIRRARGEEVTPEECASADLTVDTLDDAGFQRVIDRLLEAGVLEQVIGSGVLGEDTEERALDAVDGVVEVAILPLHGVSGGEIGAQVGWAEQAYGAHGVRFVAVILPAVEEAETQRILELDGNPGAMDFSPEVANRAPETGPGREVETAAARVWRLAPNPRVVHGLFVPALSGAEGINITEQSAATSHPVVIIAAGSSISVLAHEVGHHLGLEHIDEGAPENIMNADLPHTRDRFTPGQMREMKRNLRTQLVAGGSVARTPGPESGGVLTARRAMSEL